MSPPKLEDFGYCHSCDKRGPLTNIGLCPECQWPLAGITYTEAFESRKIAQLEAEGYLPVTAWSTMGQIALYGFIHPFRTREGFAILKEAADREGYSNFRLGSPQDALFPLIDDDQ